MIIDATFWVAISFLIFVIILIYYNIPSKIKNILNENINQIKKQIEESEKLKEEAKKKLAEQEKKIGDSKSEIQKMIRNANERAEKIICSLKKGQKKVLKRNGKTYEKFSDHIGQIPLVIISPSDRDLITDGSDTRRKFIDGVISQQDKNYLLDLISYNKVLSQRNALLKYFAANRTFDSVNLEVYDNQLITYSINIYDKRKNFLESFIPIFNKKYKIISNDKEHVNLVYKSQLHTSSFKDLLNKSLEKDKMMQYTTVGIHKDDLAFDIGKYAMKKFGSQGQQKSYLIALKLAQFEFIKQQSNLVPILLLDDIFDKLDEHRVSQIIELVNNDQFGQIFITDTHSDRTENAIQRSNKAYQIFKM